MQYSAPNKHRPFHIYTENQIYFITGRTYTKDLFNTIQRKKIFYQILLKKLLRYQIPIYAFCILDNHYHLLVYLQDEILKNFIRKLHSDTAIIFNQLDQTSGRQCFYQYWDYCPRDQKDFFLHFNYIHNNPIKHKYFNNFDELIDYRFCSYGQWTGKEGDNWMVECLRDYPVKDFIVSNDNF